jgi:hypothetical protein
MNVIDHDEQHIEYIGGITTANGLCRDHFVSGLAIL